MPPQINIELDQTTAVYFPGQTVSGTVDVKNNKDRNCDGISIKFEGAARVHFSENVTVQSGGKRETRMKAFAASEEYYKSQYFLWTDPSKNLKPGNYRFQFSFIIPHTCPASFKSHYGNIEHYCQASILSPLGKSAFCKRPYSVNSLLDLNINPANKSAQMQQGAKTLCCLWCRSGPISVVVRLDRTGYVPGEVVVVCAEVSNGSTRAVEYSKAQLCMTVVSMAGGRNKRQCSKLLELWQPSISPGGDCVWENQCLQIPPLPASGLIGCNIINVTYNLKFTVQPKLPSTALTLDFPITIGSIPLRETFDLFMNDANQVSATAPDTYGAAALAPGAPPAYFPPVFPGMEQYPNMPPPSYGQAMVAANSRPPSPTRPIMPDFTPTYVSYKLSNASASEVHLTPPTPGGDDAYGPSSSGVQFDIPTPIDEEPPFAFTK